MTQPTTQAIQQAREIAADVAEAMGGCLCDDCMDNGTRIIAEALSVSASEREALEVETWRPMDSAPLDGKHCILAVPQEDGFVYSVQGAFQNGKWNAAHRDNVQPLYWMPNVRLPEGWETAEPYVRWRGALTAALNGATRP